MLVVGPDHRLKAGAALRHPWLLEGDHERAPSELPDSSAIERAPSELPQLKRRGLTRQARARDVLKAVDGAMKGIMSS